MSTTTPPGLAGLAERAVRAARVHRAADPDGFGRRRDTPDEWNRWARRARVARTVAALQVPVNAVLVTDDPHRTYRTYRTRTGEVPGDLITVIDPLTARAWRFLPDFTCVAGAGRPRIGRARPGRLRVAHLASQAQPAVPISPATPHRPPSVCCPDGRT